MRYRRNLLAACTVLAAFSIASTLGAQGATRARGITAAEIDGDLRFLASDVVEGRAPATRGGLLATEYIAARLLAAGVEPGVNGSYFQDVPIDVVTSDSSTISVAASAGATDTLLQSEDVVVWAGSAVPRSAAHGELVFVGYGASAPEYRWDDFKGVDVKGKVLLVLVNDPPAPASEAELFGGKAMTYYGRWPYKFEEAERRGAAGMLIIHTTEEASYPWHTVVSSWTTDQYMLPRDASLPAPLGFRGWITNDAAKALLDQAGLDLDSLRAAAATREFRPVPTGITIDAGFANKVRRMQSRNVVGVVPGRSGSLSDEYVVYSAHWDHFGIGPKVNGDSIYNGALDNASGVAALLAVARSAAQSPRPRRSQLFVFVTAEEAGLLGSSYFAQNPTVPARNIIADLNMDVITLDGRVRDLTVLGAEKSSLGSMLEHFVSRRDLRISPEDHPEAGHFYRSDHFSFAKVGIPAISVGAGTDYVGRPKGWGQERGDDYTAKRYHQPSDEYRADFDLGGAAQIAQIVKDFGFTLANSPVKPEWSADAEFKSASADGR